MMSTSYYAHIKDIPEDIELVSISRSMPNISNCKVYYTKEIFLKEHSNEFIISNSEYTYRTGRVVVITETKENKFCKVLLAPTASILSEWKEKKDEQRYIERYKKEVLSKLDPMVTAKFFEKRKIVFLCYESSKDFCHRHLFADWFMEAGIECLELD